MGRGLVVHAPTSVDEGKLVRLDQLLHANLHVGVLVVVPAGEKSLLNIRELTLGIGFEGRDQGC